MSRLIYSLILLTGLFPAWTQTTISQEIKDNIKLRVDNGINQGIVIGVIDAHGVQYYSYGVKSLKTNLPVDEHSVFEIGSVTKTFTGIILADLAIKGKVNLEDPLEEYLSDGIKAPVRNGSSIHLNQLANHTSALPRLPDNFNPANPANPYADYSEKLLYEFLDTYKMTRDIGTEYEYSNYAVGLLGHILASNQKMPYEELMIRTIAKPLNLNNTRIVFTPDMKKNLAIGHHDGVEVENWDFTALAGAGGIRSTVVDMIKYVSANMGREKSKLYPAMQLAHQNSRAKGANPIVGLGWHTMILNDVEIVWHNGGTGGYRSFIGFVNGGNKGVVVLTNSTNGADDIGIHILNPTSPLIEIKVSIAPEIRNAIETQGIDAGAKTYRELKQTGNDKYDFSESQLNKLGYEYLRKGEAKKAIEVFRLNTEVYPNSSVAFYNMAEAIAQNGNKEDAIENCKKSIELNPGNAQAIALLRNLGVSSDDLTTEVVVDDKTLESYTGRYELASGFIIAISQEANQLKAQATGQPQFPIFAKSQNVFYFKVVEAQLTFNKNTEGVIESVTLNQNGQQIVGKKLK